MFVASTKKYAYANAPTTGIYTRARQMEYKSNIHNKEEVKKISAKKLYLVLALSVIMLFGSWFGMIYFKSVISGVQMQVNQVNQEIRDLEHESSLLQAEKINAMDIKMIKDTAESMGMSLPSAYQVVFVDTQEQNANMKIND
jgi:cell division protein FtsL